MPHRLEKIFDVPENFENETARFPSKPRSDSQRLAGISGRFRGNVVRSLSASGEHEMDEEVSLHPFHQILPMDLSRKPANDQLQEDTETWSD